MKISIRFIFCFVSIVIFHLKLFALPPDNPSHPIDSFDPNIVSSTDFSGNSSSRKSPYSELLKRDIELETKLEEYGNVFENWNFEIAESSLELARVKKELGHEEEAREVYNRVLQNMRIHRGLYASEQIPIILNLMAWYISEGDSQLAEEMKDWAEFLYKRVYQEDDQLPELIAGYEQIIGIIFGVYNVKQVCVSSVEPPVCRNVPIFPKSISTASAYNLQNNLLQYLERKVVENDPIIRDPLIRLAAISRIFGVAGGGLTNLYKRKHGRVVNQLKENFPQFRSDNSIIHSFQTSKSQYCIVPIPTRNPLRVGMSESRCIDYLTRWHPESDQWVKVNIGRSGIRSRLEDLTISCRTTDAILVSLKCDD